jgi:uncharacterized protein (TIGR02145 family)
MKNKINILLFCVGIFFTGNSISQVGIGTTTPHASAELDVTSTTKGFLPPRMTHAQKIAILSPAAGLQIWCTNCGSFGETQVYNGTTWTNVIGEPASFATPELTTTVASSIAAATATSGANVASDGGSAITARGVCWGTTTNPTTALGTLTSDAGTTGTFTSNITGLSASTTYYVRGYATNSVGTVYGNEIIFTTISPPTLTSVAVSLITAGSASSGGNVSSDGGSAITARGVCWSTTTNPTTALTTKTTDVGTTGAYSSNIAGLSESTAYYVRAYATNSAGTSYGNEISFTTTAFVCGSTVTFNYKGASVTYGTVLKTYTSGTKCWMDRNLGATAIPTSKVDVNGFGDLFQWGRGDDGHQSRTSSTTTSLSSSVVPNHFDFIITSGNWLSTQNDNLWQGTNGVNNPCPSGFRLPTEAEMSTEWLSWGSYNATGAFGGTGTGSGLRLTITGKRGSDGVVVNSGINANLNLSTEQGFYWTSSVNTGGNLTFVRILNFSTNAGTIGSARGVGCSVRCIKN